MQDWLWVTALTYGNICVTGFFPLPTAHRVAHLNQTVGFNPVLHFHPVFWLVWGQLESLGLFVVLPFLFPLGNTAELPALLCFVSFSLVPPWYPGFSCIVSFFSLPLEFWLEVFISLSCCPWSCGPWYWWDGDFPFQGTHYSDMLTRQSPIVNIILMAGSHFQILLSLQGPGLQLEEEGRVSSGSGNSLILLPELNWTYIMIGSRHSAYIASLLWNFYKIGTLCFLSCGEDSVWEQAWELLVQAWRIVLLNGNDFLSLLHKATFEGPHNWPLCVNQPSWVEAGRLDGESGKT